MTVILSFIVLLSWSSRQVLRNILNHLRKRNNILHNKKRELEDSLKKIKNEKINAHKHSKQLNILRHLTKEIIELKNLDELLTQITKSSIELLKGDAGDIYLYKPEKNILEWVVSIGDNIATVGSKLKPGLGVPGKVLVTGKPVIIENYKKWKGKKSPDWAILPAQVLCVPIKWRDEILGVLNIRINNKKRKKLRTKDILLSTQFASQAAIAIKNSQLFERARQEIKDREIAEKTLKESEHKYRTLMDNLGKGVCLLSQNNIFKFANREAVGIFAAKTNDLVGKSIFDFVEPDQKRILQNELVWLKEKERTNFELKVLHNKTEKRDLDVTATLQYNTNGYVPDILCIFHDITDRKQLEERLRGAEKLEAVGNLAGGIAHDFNNILTAIIGYTELSLMKIDKQNPLYKNLTGVLNAGKKGSNLTRQLLAFSRKQIIKPQILNINKLVRDLNKMLEHLIGEDITINMNLADDINLIKADPSQIEQILINLVVNSRDAINEKTNRASEKVITIETGNVLYNEFYNSKDYLADQVSHIILSVSDTGKGMDEATKEKIFEPFFTTKADGEGTGLGLATIYGIVKQNKASINVYSEPGKGTTFRIYWPVTNESISVFAKGKNPIYMGSNETILVVEDDLQVRQFVISALESLGYNVLQAVNGLEALELFKDSDNKIDLVLSDLVMPKMGGLELSENVKNLQIDVKFLFASGYSHHHILHNGSVNREYKYIEKPYTVEELAQKVRSVLTSV
ncbi:response regulator [candidate division KSB1 bacterium]|nr:response regulator [candidate division KSB1 bacterium]